MKIGNTVIKAAKIGATAIKKICIGTTIVWEDWLSKNNGYTITWGFGQSGYFYSAISPTGFKPQTIYWQIQAYNGNDYGFSATSRLEAQKQSDGLWEEIATFTWSINPVELKTSTATLAVISGKENTIYTRTRCSATNRDSLVRLATYLER